jgi:hypothetical protein
MIYINMSNQHKKYSTKKITTYNEQSCILFITFKDQNIFWGFFLVTRKQNLMKSNRSVRVHCTTNHTTSIPPKPPLTVNSRIKILTIVFHFLFDQTQPPLFMSSLDGLSNKEIRTMY